MQIPPEVWSENDIAEALGIFLGYRLPDGCSGPKQAVSTEVIRAVMNCAVGLEETPADQASVVGIKEFRVIDPSERRDIEASFIGNDLAADEISGTASP